MKFIEKLSSEWYDTFHGCFKMEEDVIDFIYAHLDIFDFKDSYIDMGGYGEFDEMFKISVEDKRQMLYNFIMELTNQRKDNI